MLRTAREVEIDGRLTKQLQALDALKGEHMTQLELDLSGSAQPEAFKRAYNSSRSSASMYSAIAEGVPRRRRIASLYPAL